jgi:serine/threonine-protein kinase RIM15
VFENILSRRIEWHDEDVDFSPEARDFMERLLCADAKRRLGANGAAEVKAHPFLQGVDWDNLLSGEVDFVPKVTDPENTDYFDARGATADQIFADDEPAEELKIEAAPTPSHPKESAGFRASPRGLTPSTSASRQSRRERAETEPSPHDGFGTFTFRNLTVLKQANDDVIRKMRDEQLLPPVSALESPKMHARPLALGAKAAKPRNGSVDIRVSSSSAS